MLTIPRSGMQLCYDMSLRLGDARDVSHMCIVVKRVNRYQQGVNR